MEKLYFINSPLPLKAMSELKYLGEASMLPDKSNKGSLYTGKITYRLPNHFFMEEVDVDFKGSHCVVTYILDLGE